MSPFFFPKQFPELEAAKADLSKRASFVEKGEEDADQKSDDEVDDDEDDENDEADEDADEEDDEEPEEKEPRRTTRSRAKPSDLGSKTQETKNLNVVIKKLSGGHKGG